MSEINTKYPRLIEVRLTEWDTNEQVSHYFRARDDVEDVEDALRCAVQEHIDTRTTSELPLPN
jgi:hypothetical protein